MNVDRSKGLPKAATVAALAYCLAALPALAQNANLVTKTANDLGVTVTGYKYDEPGFATWKATKIGFEYSGTYAIGSEFPNRSEGWFLRGDVRYANGKTDYSSSISGNINNAPDRYYEVRGLVGKDFYFSDYTLSPYVGLGYRYLYNDIRGVSTTGARGYRRESHYTSLPIGVIHKMNLANQSQLVSTVEFSKLIRGEQEAKLSDALPATPDVSLKQRSGYGLRLGTMVRFDNWSVGPTLMFWRIKESDKAGFIFEPRNSTYEFGVKGVYHF
ncbi:MAG: outer membrane beta-barrel protein [Burkholderiales bacterium]